MDSIIDKLLERLRAYDYETYNHSLRVADISVRIASQYGVTYDILQQIRTAGLLHDIGKLGICQEILTKPGKLTNIEYLIIKRHTTLGYVLLYTLGFPENICEVARNHHERPDGTGYNGETSLTLFSKIVSAADCMDVMLNGRHYKAKKTAAEIFNDICANSHKQFDPDIAAICIHLFAAGYIEIK